MEQENKEILALTAILVLVVLIGAAIYLLLNKEKVMDLMSEEPVEQAVTDPAASGGEQQKDRIRYPLPEAVRDNVTAGKVDEDSAIEGSDLDTDTEDTATVADETVEQSTPAERRESLNTDLADLLGDSFQELFIPKALIRHFVVTIDNMPREKLPQRYQFTTSPPGKFQVEEAEGSEDIFLDPANYERYTPFVDLTGLVDSQQLVDIYVRHYSLFQSAYEEIGYPDRYFNDRLIEVIDHLLATPQVQGAIELKKPKVFYIYADERLESLSAGQKIMIRIGPENSEKVRNKLQDLRRLLVTTSP